jgi:hypothetical protein
MWVGDHLTRIVAASERLPELVHPVLLRPRHLHPPVQWRAHRGAADRLRDIVGRDGLEQHRRHPDRAASVAPSAMPATNSKNCVTCTSENGIEEFSISSSCATFARRWPLSERKWLPGEVQAAIRGFFRAVAS